MCRVIDQIGIYKILQDSKGYVVCNTKGEYANHGHFKQLKTCYTIIKLMRKRTVPKSKYLRGSALRISTDKYYIEKVQSKIDKDKDRIYYFNPSKGVVR